MASPPKNPQDLWERIRKSSKDEVVLEEMVRLGFWPAAQERPGDPADEIRRRGELQRRLDEVLAEKRRLGNIEALKREARKKRMEEARRRREETRQRRLAERARRAEEWRARKAREIVYLGPGVSGGLRDAVADGGKLAVLGLPTLTSAAELAAAMGVTVGALRFLAYAREVSRVTHYRRFAVPKKSGGERVISAPMPRLKRAQEWVLAQILGRVPVDAAAHGFVVARSTVSNAGPHVGAAVVVNLDLEDFFPTLDYRRVKGLYRGLGYGEQVATVLALLSTEAEVTSVSLDGEIWHVATTRRHLPQGAPTSPALSNLACRRLDRRLAGLARRLGVVYTRYADDLTFSGPPSAAPAIGRLIGGVGRIVGAEGFRVHPKKTRVLRAGRRQEVTGLVVNRRLGVPRDQLRRFRALLHQVEKDGPAGKRWGRSPDVLAAAWGFANYVHMVDPEKGRALRRRVHALYQRHRPASAPKL